MLPAKIKVLGNTKRLRQLISKHGDVWMTMSVKPERMQCFNNELGIRISAIKGFHHRNIRLTDIEQ